MIVRQADRRDARGWSDLAIRTYCESFGGSFSDADLAEILARTLSPDRFAEYLEEDVILLAEADQRLVGFIQFGPATSLDLKASDADRELRQLYVLSDYQDRGHGKSLMDAALAHPGLRDAGNIYLDVWERNHGARRFYERYGFEVIGERRLEVVSGAETDFDLIMVRRSRAPDIG